MQAIFNTLRDPLWASILAITAIVVTILIFLAQRKVKKLGYEILLASPLFSVNMPGIISKYGKIEIFLNDRRVQGLSGYVIRIINRGNEAISPSDFVTPIKVSFSEQSSVFAFDVVDVNDSLLKEDIKAAISASLATTEGEQSIKPNTFDIPPMLLNQGDWFSIQLIVEETEIKEPMVGARITGVKQVQEVNSLTYSSIRDLLPDLAPLVLKSLTASLSPSDIIASIDLITNRKRRVPSE